MVDRVVLEALEEPDEVRELERRVPPGASRTATPPTKSLSGHLGEHVVADHEVGLPPLGGEPLGELDAEELDEGRNAARLGRRRDVRGRVDAEHRDPLRNEMLEQIAVVRGELDDEAVRAEAQPFGDHLDVATRCSTHESE